MSISNSPILDPAGLCIRNTHSQNIFRRAGTDPLNAFSRKEGKLISRTFIDPKKGPLCQISLKTNYIIICFCEKAHSRPNLGQLWEPSWCKYRKFPTNQINRVPFRSRFSVYKYSQTIKPKTLRPYSLWMFLLSEVWSKWDYIDLIGRLTYAICTRLSQLTHHLNTAQFNSFPKFRLPQWKYFLYK